MCRLHSHSVMPFSLELQKTNNCPAARNEGTQRGKEDKIPC